MSTPSHSRRFFPVISLERWKLLEQGNRVTEKQTLILERTGEANKKALSFYLASFACVLCGFQLAESVSSRCRFVERQLDRTLLNFIVVYSFQMTALERRAGSFDSFDSFDWLSDVCVIRVLWEKKLSRNFEFCATTSN